MPTSEKSAQIVEKRSPTREQNLQYYRYSLQIQDAVKSLDLGALDSISSSVAVDKILEKDERQSILGRIKQEKIVVIIAQYVASGDISKLQSVEDLIEQSSMPDHSKHVFIRKIIDGVVSIELHDAIEGEDVDKMREYQRKVFLDETIDNKKREYIFDAVESVIKRIQQKREKGKTKPYRPLALDFSGVRAFTDLRHMSTKERGRGDEELFGSYPIDLQAIVNKFRLYDYQRLQEFRERIEGGEYPMYKDMLLGIIAAFQQEFDKEDSSIEARRALTLDIHSTFKKYRNQLRNPATDIDSLKDQLIQDLSDMKNKIKDDENLPQEDRQVFEGKVADLEHTLMVRFWTRMFNDTVQMYQKEREVSGSDITAINKLAYAKMQEISRGVSEDSALLLTDKEQMFGQIRDYLKVYPTAQSLVMSLMQARFPKKS